MLDNQCYRSVASMLLLGNIADNPFQESVTRRAPLLTPLLAVVLAACSPSNASEKKGGHPGMGIPPPEGTTPPGPPPPLPLTPENPRPTPPPPPPRCPPP